MKAKILMCYRKEGLTYNKFKESKNWFGFKDSKKGMEFHQIK